METSGAKFDNSGNFWQRLATSVELSGAQSVEPSGAQWSQVVPSGAKLSQVEPSGAKWSPVELSGAQWSNFWHLFGTSGAP